MGRTLARVVRRDGERFVLVTTDLLGLTATVAEN